MRDHSVIAAIDLKEGDEILTWKGWYATVTEVFHTNMSIRIKTDIDNDPNQLYILDTEYLPTALITIANA